MRAFVVFLICLCLALAGVSTFQGFFIHSPKFREWLKRFYYNDSEDE